MSWTRTLKTTTHTFIFHKIALLTNQTNQGRSQQPISLSARCTIFHTNYNHGQKSWDTFQFLEHFQIHTGQPLPSSHKQSWTGVSRIFSEFQLCIGQREGELQENFENDAMFYDGTQK